MRRWEMEKDKTNAKLGFREPNGWGGGCEGAKLCSSRGSSLKNWVNSIFTYCWSVFKNFWGADSLHMAPPLEHLGHTHLWDSNVVSVMSYTFETLDIISVDG